MKKLKEIKVFEGIIVDVIHQDYDYQSRPIRVEKVVHPGGVCILALDENNDTFLIKQYRFGIEQELLEFPAGLIDLGESVETAAIRELQEETGYRAHKITSLGLIHPSPGYLNEVTHLFLAEKLEYIGQNLDPNESLEVIKLPFKDVIDRVLCGEITDAKTIALTYRVSEHK